MSGFDTPRLLGHRGAAAERPENTLPSFARAVEVGADVLETDVHMTRDGHVVLSHDATGERMAGVPEAIREVSYAELRRWDAGWGYCDAAGERPYAGRGIRIPSLHELLDAFEQPLNLDIKQREPPMVEPLLALVRDRGAEERVTIASFHVDVLREVRALGYRGPTALGRDEVIALRLLPEPICRRVVKGQVAQVPPAQGPIDMSRRPFLDRCHRLGLSVDYWTVNRPLEADLLLDRGADGIISDDPRRLRTVVDRYRFGSSMIPA